MISLLTLCPNPEDGTSYYRGINPLGRLKQATGGLEVLIANRVNWNEVALSDAAFFQRPCSDQHVGLAHLIKDWGIPLWVDYDDDLLSVPTDNPTHAMYSTTELRNNIKTLLRMADVVSVTTEDLKRKLSTVNPNVQVIPNAIDMKMLSYRKKLPRPETPTVLWRGTATHQRDLASVGPEIVSTIQETGARIYFQGYHPWPITDVLPKGQVVVNELMPIRQYFRFIHDMVRPQVTIVPLHDSTFNRSKSNIAWIESVFAGAPALAPDWEEWRRPGCITYSNAQDFKEKLESLIRNPGECEKQADLGWEHLQTTLSLDQVNNARAQILESLVGRRKALVGT